MKFIGEYCYECLFKVSGVNDNDMVPGLVIKQEEG